jgi:LCP family protein required for cell wall assembly
MSVDPRQPRRRRAGLRDGRKRRTRVALLVLGFLCSGLAGGVAYFMPVFSAAVTITGHNDQLPSGQVAGLATSAPGSKAPFTVLLLGSDNDAKFSSNHLLTQSMILVRVLPQEKRVVMLSVPRDLWVPIAGGGSAKIDAAYARNGARSAIATVEQDFHVHIDHYVWTGLNGLIALIDAVGGVDVVASNPVMDDFYPADIDTTNPYAFERVAVLPGAQHMNGPEALQYVRSRHGDLREDFGRSERQQQLLLALRAKAKTLSATNLPDLAGALQGEMSTDMSLSQVAEVLPLASGLSLSEVQRIILLPPYTGSETIDGQDAVTPNWDLIRPLVATYFP